MPQFQLYDLVKWLHHVSFTVAGGASVVALLLSGLEDEREEMRGLAATLWKRVVAWGFRLAVVLGLVLLAMKYARGEQPFDRYYLHLKLVFASLLLVMSELSAKPLARAKRGAPLLAVLMFLLTTFVVVNRDAFPSKPRPAALPSEVSAGPAS